MEELFDAIIQAAEKTAHQASGNDQDDWNNFAQALRVERQQLADRPKPSHPIAEGGQPEPKA